MVSDVHLSPVGRNGSGRTIWEVTKPINYFFDYKIDGKEVRVKFVLHEGFLTDGGSIPSPATSMILPTDPDYLDWFLLHDILYEKSGRLLVFANGKGDMLKLNRAEADKLSLWTLPKKAGVPAWKRWLVYPAVRLGGKKAWDKMKKLPRGQRYKILRSKITK